MKKNNRYLKLTIFLLLEIIFLSNFKLNAEEFDVNYRIETEYEHDNNIRLDPEDQISISGFKFTLPININLESDRNKLSIDAVVAKNKYNRSEFNSDDKSLEINYKHRSIKSELVLLAMNKVDSTRDNEFLDTGLVGQTASRREQKRYGFSYKRYLTESNQLLFGMENKILDYGTSWRNDYKYSSNFVGWNHSLGDLTDMTYYAYYDRYRNQSDTLSNSDISKILVTIKTMPRYNLSMYLVPGYSFTSLNRTNLKSKDFIFSSTIDWKLSNKKVSISVNKEVRPSGIGELVKDKRVNLNSTWIIDLKRKMDVNLLVGKNSSILTQDAINREYQSLEIAISSIITQSIKISFSYLHSRQKFDNGFGFASSNNFGLKFTFN